MDPTTHHNSLKDNQVRDLVANGLRDHDVSTGFFSHDGYHQMLIDSVKLAQEKLEKFEQGMAFRRISEQFNWKPFEPEAAPNWNREDYNPRTYRIFLGTEEEYNEVYGVEEE